MRRLTAMALIGAMAIASLCACGNSQEPSQTPGTAVESVSEAGAIDMSNLISENTETVGADTVKSGYDKMVEYIKSVIDTSDMNLQETTDDPQNLYAVWEYTGDTKAEVSREFTIGGHKLIIGETLVKDLDSFDMQVNKPFKEVKPQEIVSVELNKDGKTMNLDVDSKNPEKTEPIDDLPISHVQAVGSEFCIPFEYEGLTEKMTLEDLIKALGTPSVVNISTDGKLSSISVEYNQIEGDSVTGFSVMFRYDLNTEATSMSNMSCYMQ